MTPHYSRYSRYRGALKDVFKGKQYFKKIAHGTLFFTVNKYYLFSVDDVYKILYIEHKKNTFPTKNSQIFCKNLKTMLLLTL